MANATAKKNEPKPETKPEEAKALKANVNAKDETAAPFLDWDDEGSLPDVDVYYSPELCKGQWCVGTIRGFIEWTDREDGSSREMVLIRVSRDFSGVDPQSDPSEPELVVCPKGSYVGCSKRHGLANLFAVGAGSRVAFRATAQKDIGRKRKMWQFEVRIDPSTRTVRQRAAAPDANDPSRARAGRGRARDGYTRDPDADADSPDDYF